MNGLPLALSAVGALALVHANRGSSNLAISPIHGESLSRFDSAFAHGVADLSHGGTFAIYEFTSRVPGGGRAFLASIRGRFKRVAAFDIGSASDIREARTNPNARSSAAFWMKMAREALVDVLTDDDGKRVRTSRAKTLGSRSRFDRARAQEDARKPSTSDTTGIPPWSTIKKGLVRLGYPDTQDFREHVEEHEDNDAEDAVADAWDTVRDRWNTFLADARVHDPMPVWREVAARPGDVRLDGIGLYWAWAPGAAEAHWANEQAKYGATGHGGTMIAAEIRFSDINWPETALANLLHPHEYEIQANPGTPVRVLRIRDDAGVQRSNLRATA